MRVERLTPVLLSLLACGAPPAISRVQQAIVGGTLDDGDPAVVALIADGFPYCSGTLIAPHTVLTAGHCIDPLGANYPYLAAFGTDAGSPTQRVRIVSQVTHPQFTDAGQPFDLGLCQLGTAPVGVDPVALNTDPITPSDVGANIRHVGFGISDETGGTGGGVKRTVTYPVTQVSGMLVYSGAAGEQTCTGDSGGPGFMVTGSVKTERLATVVSDGPDCHSAGWDDRVDGVLDWISSTEKGWGDASRGGCAVTGLDAASLIALAAVLRAGSRARRRP